MKISWLWLKRFFPQGELDEWTSRRLAGALTRQGFLVESVRPAFEPVKGVVLGKVVSAEPHPNADRLTLCTVTAGDGERQVVCGAPNVEVGKIYGYATVGSRLPGDREIGRATIRGVDSEGMLCSAPELGLDPLGSADGIWALPGVAESDLGADLFEVLGLGDVVLDLEVESNRGDALSHLGVAREVQWIVEAECALPPSHLVTGDRPAQDRSAVRIEDSEGCPRYLGRLIDGVTVGPSPAWLQARLVAVGQRPVNNVVDVTNYAMLEVGQPLHPFDFDRIAGGTIIVRRAREGEEFTTLDGRKRVLDHGMTMICDGDGPVAVGGVMGGLESEVFDKTTTVFLESAHFDRDRIATTSRRLGLASEASTRFARGVDPNLPPYALDRAASLIAEVSGGTVACGVVGDGTGGETRREPIELRHARVAAVFGAEVEPETTRRALQTLGFEVVGESEASLVVEPPSWRFDTHREIDLVEEVARLVGYDRPPLVELPRPAIAPAPSERETGLERLRHALQATGFDEARTPSFVGPDAMGPDFPIDNLVEIRNPISKDDRYLRPFIVATLGRTVSYNLKRGVRRVKLYEIGRVFSPPDVEGAGCRERRVVALAAAGDRDPLHWSTVESPEYAFFDLKGDLEDVLGACGVEARFAPGDHSFLHPGRRAAVLVEGAEIGFCGEIHPRLAARWDVEDRLCVAEIALDPLTAAPGPLELERVPREPAVERDLALVVPEETRAAEVVDAVREHALEELAGIDVFDRYRGPQVGEGRTSLGIRLTFQADRSLTDDEVDATVAGLVEALERKRGWRLRGETEDR